MDKIDNPETFVCAVCKSVFPNEKALHNHIARTEKLKLADYYTKYHPRKDLYSGQKIEFISREQYLYTYFNNRKNLIAYYLNNPSQAYNTTLSLISFRKIEKDLEYALSQVELRSRVLPSVILMQKCGVSYKRICDELGLKSKFDYDCDVEYYQKDKNFKILVDTREQNPLKLNSKHEITKLAFGDYTVAGDYFQNVFIERKSLMDLFGTISQGYDRFKREIERAEDAESHIIVLVESEYNKALYSKVTFSHAQNSFIFHRIRELMQEYSNIQFVFVNGRKEAAQACENILLIKDASKHDMQFLYDAKKLGIENVG